MGPFKVGDTVHIAYTVASIHSDGLTLGVRRQYWNGYTKQFTNDIRSDSVTVNNPDLVSHIPAPPKPLEAGERVVSGTLIITGTLLAVHGDRGWVQWDDQSVPQSPLMINLRRLSDANIKCYVDG